MDHTSDELTRTIHNRCTAHTRSGRRCRNPAIIGATVCRMHGGAAPQVRRKAAERIAAVRDSLVGFVDGQVAKGELDGKTAVEAVVKFTQLVELLEGRASSREEVITMDAIEREIARLEREMERRDRHGVQT